MLSTDDAVYYLLDHRLVSNASIVGGALVIASAARRHQNLRVERRDGPGYLIKQPPAGDPAAAATLWREAAFYDLCHRRQDLAEVRALLPRLVHLDAAVPLFALELLARSAHLWQRYEEGAAEAFPTPVAAALGGALGTVHRVFRPLVEGGELADFGAPMPWVLRVHKPGPELLSSLSQANLKTLKILQTQEDLSRNLDRLGRLWRPDALIHGDVKSDNVLVGEGTAGGVEVRLVDWELAQVGDPAWDVAGALHDFVLFWIFSMPLDRSDDAERLVAAARYPLAALQPAMRALWRGYKSSARLPSPAAAELLARAVPFSAARLIQSAYELAHDATALPAPSVMLLQVAANLLRDPAAGQVELYGLIQEVSLP
ncbi:MAG: aminoglycoside phosphotransferase family protein [Acidobacteria bacterium]|nr:MAG: aminoglycoside phosphotransferase family protein [Acidobacteriota bacterium]